MDAETDPFWLLQHTLVHLFNLTTRALTDPSPSVLAEAQTLQGIAARADATTAKAGIAGTKYVLEKLYGYGGAPRRPLLPMEVEKGEELWEHPDTRELVRVERELSGKV